MSMDAILYFSTIGIAVAALLLFVDDPYRRG